VGPKECTHCKSTLKLGPPFWSWHNTEQCSKKNLQVATGSAEEGEPDKKKTKPSSTEENYGKV
jgi:hypothetical protein